MVAGRATSSARTSSGSTACTGRRCCCRPASSRPSTSTCTASCSSAARRCPRRASTRSRPADLVADFGVDGFRYHFLRDLPFGPDGDFSYEGMVARYNADLANNLGNLLSRVATVVDKKCGGIGPAPPARQPARRRPPPRPTPRPPRRGPRSSRRGPWRPRGGWSARPTPTSRPTSRGRPSPGPAVDAVLGDALEALRIVAVLASPAIPEAAQAIWERIGLPGAVERPAPARRRPAGAATPAACPSRRAPPLFPRKQMTQSLRRRGPTATATSTTTRARRRRVARRRPGRRRRACFVTRRHRRGPLPGRHRAGRRPRRRVGHGRPAPPRRQPGRRHRSWACSTRPRSWRSASAASTTTTTTRRATCSGGVRRPDRAGPRARPRPRDPHPRGVGRHLRHPRRRGRAGADGLPLLHRRAREAAAASTSAPTCRSRGIVTFKSAADERAAAALCPLDRLLVETDSPYLAPVPHRGRRNQPALRHRGRCRRGRGPRACHGGRRGGHAEQRPGCVQVAAALVSMAAAGGDLVRPPRRQPA